MTTLRIDQPVILIVEGDDDKNFFEALARHLGIPGVQVLSANGKDNVRPFIAAVSKAPGFSKTRALGVIRDADSNPNGAFQSVCNALAAVLPSPQAPLEVVAGAPAVSVLILPGVGRPGAIEDLCLAAVSDDPAMPCVGAYFHCLDDHGVSLPDDLSKAKVQAFLASRPRSSVHLGIAAQQGLLPLDAGAVREARQFLSDLAARLAA